MAKFSNVEGDRTATRKRRPFRIGLVILGLFSGATAIAMISHMVYETPKPSEIARRALVPIFKEAFQRNRYPTALLTEWRGEPKSIRVHYSLNADLQKSTEALLKLYHPDYGVLVTMDPNSGAILSIANFVEGDPDAGNLALKSTFPTASVFKVVTATAAIDRYGWGADDEMSYNGANHTLYKKNVMHTENNRWSRTISLRQAFAESINTVFGKIGLQILKPADLREYSSRYGFNRDFNSDMPIELGMTTIPEDANFHLAEIASGFTQVNRMSPVQGAMIAASTINGGRLMAPYIVSDLTDDQGELLYQSHPEILAQTASPEVLKTVQRLMQTTIERGTAVKSFRPLKHDRRFADMEMGGKTGSLQCLEPKGKADWFVGYAKWKNRAIAIASLTVNKEYWRVKSAVMAQQIFKQYYQAQADQLFPRKVAIHHGRRRAVASN